MIRSCGRRWARTQRTASGRPARGPAADIVARDAGHPRPGLRRRTRARSPRARRSSTRARPSCGTARGDWRCRRRSTSRRLPTATSGRCRRWATASRCSSGSARSRPTRRTRPADGDGTVLLSDAATSARWRSSTRAPSPRCAPARSPRSRRRRWPRPDAATAGIVGAGLHGAWAARCLAAAGSAPGVCYDPRRRAWPRRSPTELGAGWSSGTREEALACDVVTCVTPGTRRS